MNDDRSEVMVPIVYIPPFIIQKHLRLDQTWRLRKPTTRDDEELNAESHRKNRFAGLDGILKNNNNNL